tara:strand:- start:1212 stop:2327 length:1116 start_codon:yes stop_codon:yes gene_type:complete
MGKKSRKKSRNRRNKKSAKKYKGGGGKEDILKMLKDSSPDELVSRADELLSMAQESIHESPSSLKMTTTSLDQFPSLPRAVRTPMPKPKTAWGTMSSPRGWGQPEPEPEPEEYVREPFDSDKYRSPLHSKLTEMGDATKKEKQDAVYEYGQKEKKPKLAWLKKQQVTEFTPDLSWLPIEVSNRIYKNVVNIDELPTELTCQQVKNLCGYDPKYCKANKFKEKFHEICSEIKKTNKLIDNFNYQLQLIEDIIKNTRRAEITIFRDLYKDEDFDEYIDKMELEKEVKDIFIELINKKLKLESLMMDWYDIIMYFYDEYKRNNVDLFKDFIILFGERLHEKNKKRYYPIIIEKIKQKIINEHFLSPKLKNISLQ